MINTPTDTASKFWIGGAAQHGKVRLMSGASPMSGLIRSVYRQSFGGEICRAQIQYRRWLVGVA